MLTRPIVNIESWIGEIREIILKNHPELIDLFNTYANEALFGRELIDKNVKQLPKCAQILEIGAGSLILSCQLSREGYAVTALEPVGQGFSHFNALQSVVIDLAKMGGFCPNILEIRAEQLELTAMFDFAFSINVMEHVDNISNVLNSVVNSIKPNGCYRFICPNYTFPYEPHFNIPTIYSKKITEKFFKNKIFLSTKLTDPIGTWQSINWITVNQVRSIVNMHNNQVLFSKSLLLQMIERTVNDPIFSARRPSWLKLAFKFAIQLNLHRLTQFIPANFQPIIDCSIFSVKKV